MNFKETKVKTERWNVFNKIDLLGAFDFYTTLITLDSLTIADLDQVRQHCPPEMRFDKPLAAAQYAALARVLPLAAHEYTHFIDATSTVWGMHHLKMMNDAYLSDDRRGGKEHEFVRAKAFHDHIRNIRLPDYYTLVESQKDSAIPWSYQITQGKLFDNAGNLSSAPVIFARFMNAKGEGLARSPISMVSLLEASAMFQELSVHTSLVAQCEKDFRTVEERHFVERILRSIYDQRLTEYSVCAHIVANRLSCNDIKTALEYCALMVRVCLNATEQTFRTLGATAPVAEVLQIPREHRFTAGILAGLRNSDRGLLFYLLSQALPIDALSRGDAIHGVAEAAAVLGIDIAMLERNSKLEVERLCTSLSGTPIKPISTLATAGFSNMMQTIFSKAVVPLPKMNLPPVLLGDGNELQVFGGNMLSKFDVSACFDELYAGQSWVGRFSEGCIT